MKKALRREIASRLAQLSPERIETQSRNAAAALRELPAYKRSQSIAFYMHMDRGELRTDTMIANAFKDGKRVFLPSIVPYTSSEVHPWFPTQRTHVRMLEMPSLDSVSALQPVGKYALREPTTGFDCLSKNGNGLDLIVLPGVGFTSNCERIGHGAGFYDSYINEHIFHKGRTPLLVGVGLEEQLVPSVPIDPHDRLLDAVVINGNVYVNK